MKYTTLNWLNGIISHYNSKRYWKFKICLQNETGSKIGRYLRLLYLKRSDAYNCASLGHRINGGSLFKTPPTLPHGIKGIFISDYAQIGKNVVIYQHVTIGSGVEPSFAPLIGDNVFIGAGAIIIGKIKIGNNVKIGANCIVCSDIPSNSTVVMEKPRIINPIDR